MKNDLDKNVSREYTLDNLWIKDIKETADKLLFSKVALDRLNKIYQNYQSEKRNYKIMKNLYRLN